MPTLRSLPSGTRPNLYRLRAAASLLGLGLFSLAAPDAVLGHGGGARDAAIDGANYVRVARSGVAASQEGTLQVLHEDYADGTGRFTYFIESKGQRVQLYFQGEPARQMTGTLVRVHGFRAGNEFAIQGASDVQVLAAGTGGTGGVSALTVSGTFGPQKTAVLLVNFANNPTQPYTVATAQNVVFNTTSNFDLENSYGQTSLTGDVFGWYTIPLSSTVCDYSTLATQARSPATAAGVNLATSTRLVFAFPGNACGWWGLGTVGGNPSYAWVNGSFQLAVVGHEMGHNFGLYHSHSLECGDVPVAASCTSSEYGDSLDIM